MTTLELKRKAGVLRRGIISRYIPGVNILYRFESEGIFLTFDDGPIPHVTPYILDLLEKNEICAIFFMAGTRIKKYPEVAKQVIANGHMIGNHTFDHFHFKHLSLLDFVRDLHTAQKVLSEDLMTTTHIFRPPYGEFKYSHLKYLAKMGYLTILWSVDPMSQIQNCRGFLYRGLKKGDIVLFHDDQPALLNVLPVFIKKVKECGFQFGDPHKMFKH